MGMKIKKSSHYILPPWPLQEITWIYYISLLAKHLISYWCKTWADWYQVNITNNYHKKYFCQYCLHGCISEEVLKNHLKKCKLHKAQRIKLLEADDKECDKIKFTKTQYQLRLPFVIYVDFKAFYINKSHVSHHHINPSSPNTSITYHVGAASKWNAVMGNTLNHPKRILGWCH